MNGEDILQEIGVAAEQKGFFKEWQKAFIIIKEQNPKMRKSDAGQKAFEQLFSK